ncbi:mannitol dehydrogenase family protein [Tolypothrix sp. VBCCA 56010]|uniref:mannitol dehydrogenase family protein n=1 Tax=Tolypothrix sp. VBCCA 56010 TaxID=3137731 RepID=UPI003D7EFF40
MLTSLTDLWRQQSLYNRRALSIGIVHFGPGRFFRGHLAPIIHKYLAQRGSQEQRWGICGVSLKSRRAINTLEPQGFLYTLIKCSSCALNRDSAEVIGSISQIVDGREDRDYVLDLLTSPSVHLVTLTVTQEGYYLDKSFNLDTANEEIAHDMCNPSTPTTVVGFIVEALRLRRDRGVVPFTTVSCDNLPRNGETLRRAVLTYAELINPELAAYISHNATFSNTVVDRIVPQEHESHHNYPCRLLQVRDRAPIVTEPFWQFVVEDNFRGDRPQWEDTGVIMTKDITPFMCLKYRFLNAVHCFIACLAVRAGIEYVHEALNLPEFQLFIRLMMSDIAAATPVPRQTCEQYMAAVLLRLSNSALPDSIERISSQTSKKVRNHILPILHDAYSRKVSMKRLILPIVAWLLAVREGVSEGGKPYDAKDTLSVVTAIREGAVFSRIMGLENCELQEVVDDECHQAMLVLQTHGILTTLKNYSEGAN